MKKKSLKNTLILFCNIIIVFFTSCKKDDPLPTILQDASIDTLKGKEFIFNDLTWEGNTLTTPKRPDLFRYQQLNADVSMKFDTATNLIQVGPAKYSEDPPPYDYVINDSSLVITNYRSMSGLEGKKATIKVNF